MAIRRRRKTLPTDPLEVRIESLTHDGRGVARVEGKAVFVEGALAGELVTMVYTDIRRDYAEGRVETILEPAADRVEPHCPHFGVCGGCSLQHLADSAQINMKQELLVEQFRRIAKISDFDLFPPLTGPSWGYRYKARLGVKNVPQKGRVLVGFREKANSYIADLSRCPVLHPKLGNKLDVISELVGRLSVRNLLPQIEAAVGDDRTALIFRILEDLNDQDLALLEEFGQQQDFDIYLQRKGPDSIVPLHPAMPPLLNYRLGDQGIEFHFHPKDFTQINVEINRKMVDRVMDILALKAGDRVLDLFCGIGNFSLPIARQAGFVVGVEGNAEAIERARYNASMNGLENVEFHVADLTQPQNEQPWANSRFDKILLDPSRAGAEEILQMIPAWGASRIVYVSCNPSTLARDSGILVHEHGYRLVKAGVMDMFPQTAHVESIALFEK